MAKKSAAKEIPFGVCEFCNDEFEKKKMTQHLKYCKQRAIDERARTEGDAASDGLQKTTLYHLVVEGRYNPQYWMHLEMPAFTKLEELDWLLRDIWLECCGHLSAFKIGEMYFSSELDSEEEEEIDEEVYAREKEEYLAKMRASMMEFMPSDVSPERLAMIEEMVASAGKRYIMDDLSMNVRCGKIFKPGLKFSYTYDFGSSTDLSLRVVAVREGEAKEHEKEFDIQLLAMNLPPVILCGACGKPATWVTHEFMGNEPFCTECLKKKKYEYREGALPVVNSPRVGTCAYDGGEGELYKTLYDEDEEIEDGEEEGEDEEDIDE